MVARSIYHPSLQHWMRVFPSPQQLLVVTAEDLARDEEDVLSKVRVDSWSVIILTGNLTLEASSGP